MSGKINPPLLAPEQATKLLDDVVYERVLSFIDLDGLFGFEQELWSALDECGVAEDEIADRTNQMITHALQRVAEDPRRWGVFHDDLGACMLCEPEAKPRRRA